MKTEELIKELEFFADSRGYYVTEDDKEVYLYAGHEELLLSVDKRSQYHLETNRQAFHNLGGTTKRILFSLIVEYARTPLEEREEEKKYVYRMDFAVAAQEYLKVKNTGVVRFEGHRDFSANEPYFKSEFTDAEVENYPKEVRELFKICEKIEVTP